MRSRLVALSLLAGVLVPAGTALAASPKQPTGNIGVQLVGVPAANLRADPLAHLYIAGTLAPGTRIRRSIEISNTTNSTAEVTVYPAAAGVRRGVFVFAPGHTRNELSSWTSVSRGVLPVLPGGKAFETITVTVPRDAASGEQYGVVWAEVSAPAAATGGVTLVNRVGVRMYLSIGPGGGPPSDFAIGSVYARVSADGEPLVVANVDNTGPRTLDITGSLTLSHGPGGLRTGPFQVELAPALAPDGSEPATVRLAKGLPRGPWRASLRLGSGFIERSAVATITFPGRPTPRVTTTLSRGLILAGGILAVLLAAAALGLLLFRRISSRTGRP